MRRGYASRLPYFSKWISDGERRGLVHDLGAELGRSPDRRPLRFMTEHRASYPAIQDEGVFAASGAMERSLDGHERRVIPTKRIPEFTARIEAGDLLAFATSIPGLNVPHSAMANRDRNGVLRGLHAPLSGGVVEVSRLKVGECRARVPDARGDLGAL